MRLTMLGLALAAALAACVETAPPGAAPAAAPPADTPQSRATFQLRSRLGGEPVLSNLRQGTDDGKAVLCGEAAVAGAGAAATPFVLRGGYLVLPADSSPEQFATLQSLCTEAVTGQDRVRNAA